MQDIYNTVLTTYLSRFNELPVQNQFHFLSRLKLWQKDSISTSLLDTLRPVITAKDQPELAIRQLMQQPLPVLSNTSILRNRALLQYPQTLQFERTLIRLLFMQSVYDIDAVKVANRVLDFTNLTEFITSLNDNHESLLSLSTYGVNILYIYDQLLSNNADQSAMIKQLEWSIQIPVPNNAIDRQIRCYFYTHCIIAQSLYYSRPIPAFIQKLYLPMIRAAEKIIADYFDKIKLDICFEFLVCCKLIDYKSSLQNQITTKSNLALTNQGFVGEPLKQRFGQNELAHSEHRNIMFLMSLTDFN